MLDSGTCVFGWRTRAVARWGLEMSLAKLIPPFRRRDAWRVRSRAGFGVTPVLALFVIVGVLSMTLFTGYTSSLKNSIALTNSVSLKTDFNLALVTLSASSELSNDETYYCPPTIEGDSDLGDGGEQCPGNMHVILEQIPLAGDARVPVSASGPDLESYVKNDATDVGIFLSSAGIKRTDPWGRYYIVCRWKRLKESDEPVFQIISAGPDGIIRTHCGQMAVAGSGNHSVLTSISQADDIRASIWQVTTSQDGISTATYGAHGVAVDASGNLNVPGNLDAIGLRGVDKVVFEQADIELGTGNVIIEQGNLEVRGSSSRVSASSGLFEGAIEVAGNYVLGSGPQGVVMGYNHISGLVTTLTAGSAGLATSGELTSLAKTIVINNAEIEGVTSVEGVGTDKSSVKTYGSVAIADNVSASGPPVTYLSVGVPIGTVFPFSVDQHGGMAARNIVVENATANNNLIIDDNLSISNNIVIKGAFLGTTTVLLVNTTELVVEGTLRVKKLRVTGTPSGAVGEGSTDLTTAVGILPLSKGGTEQSKTTEAELLHALGGGDARNLVSGTLDDERLPLLSPSPAFGPYNTVYVDSYGRVTSGSYEAFTSLSDEDGDLLSLETNSIIIKINNLFKGRWDEVGLSVGSSGAARASLDLGYAKDAAVFPVGTTGEQPVAAVRGMMRYNTDIDGFEGYQGDPETWVPFTAGGPINGAFEGVCGADHGKTISNMPTKLCLTGIASRVVGTGNPGWSWTCTGTGDGLAAECSALGAMSNASCGADAGTVLSATPTRLCIGGTPSAVKNAYDRWTWGCFGIAGGGSASCLAFPNGVCNPMVNNLALDEPPSQEIGCSSGVFGNLTSIGTTYITWSWTCAGNGGGTASNCQAFNTTNGACGAAHEATLTSAPEPSQTCTSGALGPITGTPGLSMLYWNCNPVGFGTTAACRANAPVADFSFTPQTGVGLSTAVYSNAVTLGPAGGFINFTAICGPGCSDIAINGVSKGTTSVSGINAGDNIAIRHVSSASYGSVTTAKVTVGSKEGTFAVTTVNTANAFVFASQTGLPANSIAVGTTTPTWSGGGTLVASAVSCTVQDSNCQVSCDGGGTWATTCALSSGSVLQARQTTSGSYFTETVANITVGGTASSFSAKTVSSANPFSFEPQTAVGVSTVATSSEITPTWVGGGTLTVSIPSCTGTSCHVSCNGGTFAATCNLTSGQTLAVRQTSSASHYTQTVATVRVGSTDGAFSVTTVSTADSFTFPTQTAVALGTAITSDDITPTWPGGGVLHVSIPSCTGASCLVSCNGGGFASTCTLASGQTLAVRQTSSASHYTTTFATVRVGSTDGTFSVRTIATAGAFTFASQTGVALSVVATSANATPTWTGGETLPVSIPTCTGTSCQVSCNGGAFAETCNLTTGQTLAVRQTSSASYGTATVATVRVGSTNGTFSVTTVNTAGGFTFATQTGVAVSTVITSANATPAWTGGGTLPVSIPSCTGTSCQVSCNGGTFAATCNLTTGQTLAVRQTSSASYYTETVATVQVGSTNGTFTVRTIATAGAFTFASQTGVARSTVITSANATPTWTGGETLPVSIPTCTGTSCQVSCNGGAYATTCNLTSGQTLAVRQTSSASYGTETVATVRVGSTNGTFSVTTVNTAGAFSFATQTGVAVSTVITSANATPTWTGGGALPVSIPSCTGTSCQVSCNGAAYATTCNLTTGQTLAVRQTSSASHYTETVATVQVGSTNGTFTVRTIATAGAFTFASQTGVALSTVATSANATPTWTGGETLAVSIPSCTGTSCQVSCNGAAYAATCNLTTGQTLAVRQTSSASYYTETVATVQVGSTTGTFTVRTIATAGAFTFASQTGVALSTVATSANATPTWTGGETLAVSIPTCTGTSCQISCNGGTYATTCNLTTGQTLAVRQTSSASYGTATVATVRVGSTNGTFSVTTVNTAGAFTFATQTAVPLSAVRTSANATPTWTGGGTLPVSIPSCTGTSCQVSCNGGTYATTCNLTTGQTLAVRQTSSATHYTETVATVQVGSTTGTFTVRTIATAGAFTFASQTGVAVSTVRTSANATPTWTGGDTLTASVPSCTGTSCQVSCNGGTYAATCNLTSGQTLAVRQTSSASHYTETVATVQVGSTTGTFTVRTIATAGAFTFASQTGVALSTVATSANATPTWTGGETLAVSIPTCTGTSCQVSCNGAAYAATCNLTTGQTLAVRQTSSASYGTATVATVRVGSTNGTFTVTTIVSASAYSFTAQTGIARSTATTATASPTWSGGHALPVTLSSCTGTSCGVSCNGGAYGSSCTLSSGQTLAVRQTTSSSFGTATNAVTLVGSTSATFTVTTVRTANAFSFASQTGRSLSTVVTASATPSWTGGGTLTATLSSCTGTSCAVSCSGGAYASSCNLTTGQTLTVRQTTSASMGVTTVANVTVGSTAASFSATTLSDPCAGTPAAGTVCMDGTVYAGLSPDGNAKMYAMPCDLGMTASCSGGTCTCSGSRGIYSWNDGTFASATTGYTSYVTGKANTAGLVSKGTSPSPAPYVAARECAAQTYAGKSDWYLPAYHEILYLCYGHTNMGDGNCSRATAIKNFSISSSVYYWSSTEYSSSSAVRLSFGNPNVLGGFINFSQFHVRCVRR